jgi:hypothetical protein
VFVDHHDPITVHLVHPNDAVVAQSERGGEPPAVGRHRGRVVADVVAEIEGVERRRGDATGAGRGHAPNANGHGSQCRRRTSGA